MEMIGRVPPHNLEAEQSVLGAMILDKEAITDVSEILTGEKFYKEAHEIIFNSIIDLYNRNEPVDLVTVANALDESGILDELGGVSYLSDLTTAGIITTNALYYGKIIEEKSILRRLIRASAEIVEKGYASEGADSLLDLAESSIFDISQNKTREGFSSMREVLVTTFDNIEKVYANKGELTGVPSGFVDLDRKTSGFQRSDMILIAARPSMGKTAFSLNLCQFAAMEKDMSVAIFSLEMAKDQLVQRMLSSESKISIQNIRNGDIDDDDWLLLGKAVNSLSNAKIYIDDTPAITVTEMRAKCRRLKMEHGLDMIMIDYLQLMSGGSKAESRQQEISTISRNLKGLAREMNCPILALSQLSRAPELRADHRPILSDLRESGAIEQDADLVMFLYRDEYYFQDSEKKNIGEVIIAKQRNGETGSIELFWDGQYTRFRNLDRAHEGDF